MERREDIRAAIQNLLATRQTGEADRKSPEGRFGSAEGRAEPFALSDSQVDSLRELQSALRENQINAEIPEIVHAMLEALSSRPALCKGLVAAYLLGA